MKVQTSLQENINYLDLLFNECGDIVSRKFPVGDLQELECYIVYIDLLTNRDMIETNIIEQFLVKIRQVPPKTPFIKETIFDALKNCGIITADLKEVEDFEVIANAVLSGDTPFFIDGYDKAIIVSTKKFPNRGIPKAETEVVVHGSKEAFSEVFRFNTALIRRRIRDTRLKVYQVQVGTRSKTDVALMYLDDVVRPKILKDVKERIENIDIDAILDSGYIEQLIEDDYMSPFPQMQVTERPDTACAGIFEGRIVVVVDNSPFVLIIPATFNTFFQSAEDYYERWEIMSFVRCIRYLSGLVAVTFPALYIAVAEYHPSMISMPLTLKMAGSRGDVPIPAVAEILLMDLAFEILREAGLRLPGAIGGTVGIVGGIIIGQSAVEAGLVSPIVVIVVALTGICSFTIPHVSLVSGFRLTKYVFIILSATLGLFGFWLAGLLILIHLASLKSFGIPYLFPYSSGEMNGFSDIKDSIIRLPLFLMKKRPFFANENQRKRLNVNKTGNKRKKE